MSEAVSKCPVCDGGFDRSAIDGCFLWAPSARKSALVYGGVGDEAGLHLHDVTIADGSLLTWRGFLDYKTARIRWGLFRWSHRRHSRD